MRDAAASSARRAAAAALRAARWAWAHRPSGQVGAAAAFAALVTAAGLGGTLFQATLRDRLPSPLDWAAAAALLERDARPGDAILPSPRWAERIRALAPAVAPVLALPRIAGEDLLGVRRAWLVALPEVPGYSPAPELELLDRGGLAGPTQRLGRIEVTRFTLSTPALALAYLPDRLGAADVRAGDRPCAAERDGFRCTGPERAVRIERAVRDVAGAARPCIAASPGPAPGEAVVVAFPSVPMGRAVRGHATAVRGGRDPVRLAIQIEGEEVASVELAPGAGAWIPFQVDTTRHAGHVLPVAFVVTGEGAGASALCFEAMTLP